MTDCEGHAELTPGCPECAIERLKTERDVRQRYGDRMKDERDEARRTLEGLKKLYSPEAAASLRSELAQSRALVALREHERDEAVSEGRRMCIELMRERDQARRVADALMADERAAHRAERAEAEVARLREVLRVARNALTNPHPNHVVDAEQHEALRAVDAALAGEEKP